MTNFFLATFILLNEFEIVIDNNEFIFQTQSHPNYTSILSLSDRLVKKLREQGFAFFAGKKIDGAWF